MARRWLWLAGLVWVLGQAGSCAAQEWKVPWDALRDAGARYLAAVVAVKDQNAMERVLKDRVELKARDSGWDEDTAMRSIMLDWAVDNQGDIKRKKPKAVAQACFYFLKFREKRYEIPSLISQQLTQKAVADILKYLDEQIKNAEPSQK